MSDKPWETETAPAPNETLLGSNVQPATFTFAGAEVPLGEVVAFAHVKSGLTVEEWNDLPDEEREAHIQAIVDENTPAELTFDELKARADELGVQYAGNIGEDTLRKRVAEAEAVAPTDTTPELDSTGQPKTGALTGTNAHVDTAADLDGSSDEQNERIEKAGVVVGGDQAPLALVNLISQGYTMKEARKRLGIK